MTPRRHEKHEVSVPLLDLEAQNRPLRDEILAAVARVVDSQRFILGPEVTALEDELARALDVGHAVAVSSGTDALLVALMAVGVGPGDEVITSPYSFFSTASVIGRLGARPVFVDIERATFNIDASRIPSAVTSSTRALLPVHLFGLSADLDAIMTSSRRAGSDIPVVEDAAQAMGATYRSRVVGGVGAMGCFSFYPTKNLGALGEAGLVATSDAGLADRLRRLRDHGMAPKYHHSEMGGNFRMDAMQAAILRVKAPHLPAWTEARRLNARRYMRLFEEAGLTDRVVLPVEPAGRRHIFNQFVIRTADRDGLQLHLDERGIGSEIYYPVPLHLQPCFAGLGYGPGDFPESERAARESLAIPIYGELSLDQQAAVVHAVAGFVRDRTTA